MLWSVLVGAGIIGATCLYLASYTSAGTAGRNVMSLGLRRAIVGPNGRHAGGYVAPRHPGRHVRRHEIPIVDAILVTAETAGDLRYWSPLAATAAVGETRSVAYAFDNKRYVQDLDARFAAIVASLDATPDYLAAFTNRTTGLMRRAAAATGRLDDTDERKMRLIAAMQATGEHRLVPAPVLVGASA